mmetsp:Transcript_24113/g.71777  ORF Transcript_24113/g.71777 Transcript_24113/m.71777 type:complete len:95 (+) Transcript_24113:108-392(+)
MSSPMVPGIMCLAAMGSFGLGSDRSQTTPRGEGAKWERADSKASLQSNGSLPDVEVAGVWQRCRPGLVGENGSPAARSICTAQAFADAVRWSFF